MAHEINRRPYFYVAISFNLFKIFEINTGDVGGKTTCLHNSLNSLQFLFLIFGYHYFHVSLLPDLTHITEKCQHLFLLKTIMLQTYYV